MYKAMLSLRHRSATVQVQPFQLSAGEWPETARLARSDLFRRRSSFSSHSSRSASTAGTGLHAPVQPLVNLERTAQKDNDLGSGSLGVPVGTLHVRRPMDLH